MRDSIIIFKPGGFFFEHNMARLGYTIEIIPRRYLAPPPTQKAVDTLEYVVEVSKTAEVKTPIIRGLFICKLKIDFPSNAASICMLTVSKSLGRACTLGIKTAEDDTAFLTVNGFLLDGDTVIHEDDIVL